MKQLIIWLGLTLLLSGTALAGQLSPGLELFLDTMADDEMSTAMLAMSEQADIPALSEELHRAQAPLSERHEQVVSLLMETAATTQADLLTDLEHLQQSGLVEGWASHWLSNMVIVRATVATIRELAAREDVERAELDLRVTLIEPVEVGDGKVDPPSRSIVEGVDNIEADRVWYELGIFGENAIVAGIDTGVMGGHEAFATRWQGYFSTHEEGWLDCLGNTNSPSDSHGHGTHTMGTMVGASSDTIGVAPGARWIATNPIDQGTGGGFDNDIIAALEWVCDPDGDPGTVDDMADVAQNSWGVNEWFSGYYDCDSRWWDAIDNCEAAGTVLTWSAGNEGPGGTSLRSPADRADSPTNCFSIGSTMRYPPFTISNFSSRGPSGCGGPYEVKPEVVAPGSDIYSASNSGGYEYMSGTSMAGPHVAGVVALMRSANPDVDVETVKQILMDTAIDLGTVGEDNTYGWGFVDAFEAVLAVMQGYGTVSGTVTSSDGGLPIEGARVRNVDGTQADNTSADGEYELFLPAGDYTLEFSAFGHFEETAEVAVPEDGAVTVDMELTLAPTALLSGYVYDPEGAPLPGAEVSVLDTPLDPAHTDDGGFYSLEMPTGAVYQVRAWYPGMGADQQYIEFTGDMTVDFNLADLVLEDFESGSFNVFPWEMGGNSDWTIQSDAHEGEWCAQSGGIGDNQNSSLSVSLNVLAEGDITFWYRVSSEGNYDYLRFKIDGSEVASWSGEVPWTEYATTVEPGEHTFTWDYTKDYSVSNGSDCGWVDYIVFPPIGPPPLPDIAVDPTAFNLDVELGEQLVEQLTITNEGDGDLEYTVTVSQQVRETTVPWLELEPGEHDPRPAVEGRDEGGPDGHGYIWIDSEEEAGPEFNWVEINESGNMLPPVDDACWGPFPLGFEFEFYGVIYDGIYVSTNGLLSFTSDSDSYSNQGIPHSAEPNCLIAPFWDNLNPATGGTIYYLLDSDNERFIVEWDGVNHYYQGSPETFQVILNGDGTILFQYLEVSYSSSATVGIENQAGNDGLEISFNSNYLQDELAVLIMRGESITWLEVDPAGGTINPLDSDQLEVTLGHPDLPEGTCTGSILIESNDPDEGSVELPVTLLAGYLEPVTDLTIMISQGNLLLGWSPVAGAAWYTVWECDEPHGEYLQIGTTGFCTWSQPVGGTARFYRVVAGN